MSQSASTNGPKPITLKLSGTIYGTNMYNAMVADNTSEDVLAVSDEEIDRCFTCIAIAAGTKLVILW
ncbi:MAG: hypothetical protein WBZ36_07420 [Candidatus Nitrosopolaris sp.]